MQSFVEVGNVFKSLNSSEVSATSSQPEYFAVKSQNLNWDDVKTESCEVQRSVTR